MKGNIKKRQNDVYFAWKGKQNERKNIIQYYVKTSWSIKRLFKQVREYNSIIPQALGTLKFKDLHS